MENIINFISNIDNSTYNKIRHSKSDAECRRYLKEQLTKQLNLTDVVDSEAKLLAFSKFLLDRSYVRGRYYPKTLVKLFKGK